jgi:hypothetical protein
LTDDDTTLAFNYLPVASAGKPVISVRLSTTAHATVVAASLAPSLPRTVLAPLWAAAIDLSQGGTVVAQVQTRMALNSPTWGPQVILVPLFATELDEVSATYAEEDAEDVDWRTRDLCLLGHDFLCNLTVILDGRRGHLVLDVADD